MQESRFTILFFETSSVAVFANKQSRRYFNRMYFYFMFCLQTNSSSMFFSMLWLTGRALHHGAHAILSILSRLSGLFPLLPLSLFGYAAFFLKHAWPAAIFPALSILLPIAVWLGITFGFTGAFDEGYMPPLWRCQRCLWHPEDAERHHRAGLCVSTKHFRQYLITQLLISYLIAGVFTILELPDVLWAVSAIAALNAVEQW